MDRPPLSVAVVSPREIIQRGVQALLAQASDRILVVDIEADVAGTVIDVVVVDEAALSSSDARTAGLWLTSAKSVVLLTVEDDLRFVDKAIAEGVVAAVVPADASASDLFEVVATAVPGIVLRSPAPPRWPALCGLSERERQILLLMVKGMTNSDICDRLFLSQNTVKTYIRSAYRKIGVTRRSQAVLWCLQHSEAPATMESPVQQRS